MDNDSKDALVTTAEEIIDGRDAEIAAVLGYAQRLAIVLWEKHWKASSPNWKPLPDLMGVLTQIDNMTAGLVRALEQKGPPKGPAGDHGQVGWMGGENER